MKNGINKVTLVGYVGEDPHVNQIRDNMEMAYFSLATNENYTDKEGKVVDKTEWHRIVVWNKKAEIVKKFVKKGSPLYIEGKIRTNSWEDKEGNKKYGTEVYAENLLLLSSKEK